MKEKMKDKTREDERDKRGEQKIKRSTEDEIVLLIVLRRGINLTIQRPNCRFQKINN